MARTASGVTATWIAKSSTLEDQRRVEPSQACSSIPMMAAGVPTSMGWCRGELYFFGEATESHVFRD